MGRGPSVARGVVMVAALLGPLAGCPGDAPEGTDTDPPATDTDGPSTGTTEAGTPPADSTASSGEATTTPSTSADSGSDDTTAGEPTGDGSTSTGIVDEPGPDLREQGPYAVRTSSGTAALPGCSMAYDLRTPAGLDEAPVVVLAHGFQGNRGTMAGWAEHWASWGVRVVTPDLCHATIIDTDHPQNAVDLRALVDELALGPVIWSGYSAGGLAAVLAAADDDQAVALVGLDMVDASGLGMAAAPGVNVPAFDLVGEPSQCNTTNNGLAVFGAMPSAQALRITEADHCDFQSPADFLCGLTCTGSNMQFDEGKIMAAILGVSTAAVVWQAGIEPTGAQWWTPGAPWYDELAATGILGAP